jgi:hypothetical protein
LPFKVCRILTSKKCQLDHKRYDYVQAKYVLLLTQLL